MSLVAEWSSRVMGAVTNADDLYKISDILSSRATELKEQDEEKKAADRRRERREEYEEELSLEIDEMLREEQEMYP